MAKLRAVIVCVDYSDFLSLTLPYNRDHFDEVLVVTSPHDKETLRVAQENHCSRYVTDAFYRNGASFNKWLALEEALDHFRREGWICLKDADVLWPKDLHGWEPEKGYLYSPLRHMCEYMGKQWLHEPNQGYDVGPSCQLPFPPEKHWWEFYIHRNVNEWAGYTQIFHTDDPHLGSSPWHQTDWKHAGGADSFFQQKWPPLFKKRTPWNVLHLGQAGTNWCGRVTDMLDGTKVEKGEERATKLRQFMINRRLTKSFDGEKLS